MADKILLSIDRTNFVECKGLTLSPEHPRKLESNPIIKPGHKGLPDSFRAQFGGSIIKQGEIYRVYYVAFDNPFFGGRPALAESKDGLEWKKPVLSKRIYKGSYKNNLLGGFSKPTDCISVLYDKQNKRYIATEMDIRGLKKSYFRKENIKGKWGNFEDNPTFSSIGVSKDSINWKFLSDKPPILEKFETARIFRVNDKFIINGQQTYPWVGTRWRGREVSFFKSKDLKTWEKCRETFRNFDAQTHIGISNLGKFGKTYLGLVGVFYDADELPDQHFEIRLVYSKDCLKWKAPFKSNFIRRGDIGTWDYGGVLQGDGYIEKNENYLIYYSGTNIGNTPFSRSSIGVVSLPKDRFGYYSNKVGWDFATEKSREGVLITRVIKREGGTKILLNVSNTSMKKYFKVCLLDKNKKEIPGYTLEESKSLYGDAIAKTVKWKNKRICLPDTDFRIRIHFYGGRYREDCPQLYAIYIK